MPDTRGGRSDKSDVREFARAAGMAIDFIITILVLAGGGYLIDRWQGTSPTWTLVGLGVGFVAAVYRIIREAMKMDAAQSRRSKPPVRPADASSEEPPRPASRPPSRPQNGA